MSRFSKYCRLAMREGWSAIRSSAKQSPEAFKRYVKENWKMFVALPVGDKFFSLGAPVTFGGFAFGIAYDIAHWHRNERRLPMTLLAGFGTCISYYTSPLWLPVAAVAVPAGLLWRKRVIRVDKEERIARRSRRRCDGCDDD